MPACHAGGRGFESLPDRHCIMIAEIVLQTALAAIIGGIWLTPLVVGPAARASLDDQGRRYFLKSFFIRFNIFLIIMIALYLGVFYFFILKEYEIFFSVTANFIMTVLLFANILNLIISFFLDGSNKGLLSFKIFHSLSTFILAVTSFASLYLLIEKFLII